MDSLESRLLRYTLQTYVKRTLAERVLSYTITRQRRYMINCVIPFIRSRPHAIIMLPTYVTSVPVNVVINGSLLHIKLLLRVDGYEHYDNRLP